jgi:hypothetical protein
MLCDAIALHRFLQNRIIVASEYFLIHKSLSSWTSRETIQQAEGML